MKQRANVHMWQRISPPVGNCKSYAEQINVLLRGPIYSSFHRHRMPRTASHNLRESLQNCGRRPEGRKRNKKKLKRKFVNAKCRFLFFMLCEEPQNGNGNTLFNSIHVCDWQLGTTKTWNSTQTEYVCIKWQNTGSRSTFNLLLLFGRWRCTNSRFAHAFAFTVQLLLGLLLEFTLTNLLL